MRRLTLLIILVALASCGAKDDERRGTNEGAAMEHLSLARLSLASDAFRNGEQIPSAHGCDGSGSPPILHWGQPPPRTRSFVLVLDDPDAPGGTFRHWGMYDIPASARSAGGGQRPGAEVRNDFGKMGYGGPCPPKGHGPHHYHFKLYALDIDHLGVPAGASIAELERAALPHAIAEGELVGIYERR